MSTDEDGWRRLDARMLLIHPLQTLGQFLPVVITIIFARGGAQDSDRWELYLLPLVVLIGVLRWLTTRYRITPDAIELRRGVLFRQLTTARLDKIRAVDLTARVYHRVLGLSKVAISTGSSARGESFELDSLATRAARSLQVELLRRRDSQLDALPSPTANTDAAQPGSPRPFPSDGVGSQGAAAPLRPDAPEAPAVPDEVLLRARPSWARYAPLTMTGLAAAGVVVGFASQVLQRLSPDDYTVQDNVWSFVAGSPVVAVLILAAAVCLLAVLGYVLTFHGFVLTRHASGHLNVRRGLLTTRETSIDPHRLRGVDLGEPLGLRLAGAARLRAVSTGLGPLAQGSGGSDWLVPPAPAPVSEAVSATVLHGDQPLAHPLVEHGPVARRRRIMRALWSPVALLVGLGVCRLFLELPWWLWLFPVALLALAVPLGLDRYRGLGHAITPEGYLVSRSGSLDRHTVALMTAGVIGWRVTQSFFQRRQGVATLKAVTAAGSQGYDIIDIPLPLAWQIIDQVNPRLVTALHHGATR